MKNRRKVNQQQHRGTMQKSSTSSRASMFGIYRNQFWFAIIVVFALWSVLVYLNYYSVIHSVTSLAMSYVYSVNQQETAINRPLASNSSSASRLISSSSRGNDTKESAEDSMIREDEGIVVGAIGGEDDENKVLHVVERKDDNFVNGNDVVSNNQIHPPPRPPRKRGRKRGRRRGRGKNAQAAQWGEGNNNNYNYNGEVVSSNGLKSEPSPPPPLLPRDCKVQKKYNSPESCTGRYIYVHKIPRRYNVDLLRDCKSLDLWMDMCQYVKNSGLGLPLTESEEKRTFSDSGWFATNQFLLEVIFHNRMKQYDCLTNDSSQASAIFVPFYAGLDVARHLWNGDAHIRDFSSIELVKWLRRRPEWKKFWGRDHFFVAGRITWDFRRSDQNRIKDPDWGTKLLYLPEAKNMTALVIESSPWNNNDFGIPYPTYFHPWSDQDVFHWQNKMRKQKRRYLFSFAGAPRPDRPDSIRNQIIEQCEHARGKCMLIRCNDVGNKCHKPAELMKIFQTSVFCLQPPGDSYTRRSTFDSILAGCIPVLFHPGSAYIQYLWHLPKDYTRYSVFISLYDIRDATVSIEKVLQSIPVRKVWEMREEVIGLIPKIIYADPRCRLETLEDAFDVAVKGVLERVDKIKEDIKEGRDDSFGYDERQAWKYRWAGKLAKHEWDPYFSGTFEYENTRNVSRNKYS